MYSLRLDLISRGVCVCPSCLQLVFVFVAAHMQCAQVHLRLHFRATLPLAVAAAVPSAGVRHRARDKPLSTAQLVSSALTFSLDCSSKYLR